MEKPEYLVILYFLKHSLYWQSILQFNNNCHHLLKINKKLLNTALTDAVTAEINKIKNKNTLITSQFVIKL